jgi:uncharacterized phage protein gp47/JayE
MFPILNFYQVHQIIVQEIRNRKGLSITADSDASIRADGTASVVEGLYQHQNYIQRQLFAQTADEAYLYIHAEEVDVPRAPSGRASGSVKATSNVEITLSENQKITDGKGHFYTVTHAVLLAANHETIVSVEADQMGAAWNFSGDQMIWVSPPAGLRGTANVISIGGGTDVEEVETWRERILTRKRLGSHRDRALDIETDLKEVPGVKHVYVYPKRRGLGSMDVAITAAGNPPAPPSPALISAAQLVLDATTGFWADSRIYSPTIQLIDVSAAISGTGVDLEEVRGVIRNYFAEIAPAQGYQESVLNARIMNVLNVVDVVLSPSTNVVPIVNWMHTHWLRLGALDVRYSA